MPDQLELYPGEIVEKGDPPVESLCYPPTIAGLFKLIRDYLAVRLTGKKNFRFIIISSQTPDNEGIGHAWLQTDPTENVQSLQAFVQGDWRPVYLFPPFHAVGIVGNPNDPPPGWRAIDGTLSQYPNMTTLFKTLPEGKTFYYAAFVGYSASS